MHKHIYRKYLFSTLFILAFSIGLPAFVTLCFNHSSDGATYSPVESGKTITFEDENSMDVEKFIPCVMAKTLSPKEPEELLKAFAIVIRTDIYKKLNGQSSIEVSQLNLSYLSYEEMKKQWEDHYSQYRNRLYKAMEQTALQVITYENTLIQPEYHQLSCGKTRAGSEKYLTSVECSPDMEASNYLQTSVYSIEAFVSALKELNPDLAVSTENPLETFQITSRDDAGYVTGLQIGTTAVDVSAFANKFSLASHCFEADAYNGGIRLLTKGAGSGYGMSLYTARNMAKDGKSCTDILNFFYAGTAISH